MSFKEIFNITRQDQKEITCPLISLHVICASCESPDFSIDEFSPRSVLGKKVPGTCDDCGHKVGKLIN